MTDEVETADKVAEAQPAGVSRDVILVVDDEDSIRRLLRLSLSRRLSGFEIVEAVDGLNALEQLRNGLADKVAVILVDNIMPRMSGMDVIAEIRGEPTRVDQTLSLIHVDAMKRVPVFFMSGNTAADPNVNIDDLLRRRLITEFVQK
ncbi:response regulator, partial [Candidatus Peregrinibacteria bacterium]|nr:response regulator [Candidatus Peregrinibacteria bacterium]